METKVLIIYVSIHHGNTEKIARAMAEVLKADLAKPNDVTPEVLQRYGLTGFGSGIYFGRHHSSLLKLVERLPNQKGRKAFIFSTSGLRKIRFIHDFNKPLWKKLAMRGFEIIGEFNCRGWDTYPFWVKPLNGINKGKPGEKEIDEAKLFAETLKKKY